MAYKQRAGRARVYQLHNEQYGQYFALKEFRKLYRTPNLIDSYKNLHRVEDFEGLRAARRHIVLPADPAAQRYPSLEYAMLMPWIHGTTWFDVLGQAREDGDYPDLSIAIGLCDRFLEVMEGLEANEMAHTDISPGNVMVGFDPIDVQLVDLEEMYMPGADAPPQQTTGASGYRHRSEETTWKPEGDRYAAAVLAAEMLILAKLELARKATDEGFFTDNCQTPEGMTRFREARPWLEEVAPEFARVFERSWYADSLEGCPSISELREPIKKLAKRPLAPESPKRVETPISRQPSAESKAALGTTSETPVVGSGVPKRPSKRLIGAGLAMAALLVMAVGVGVWSTTSESNAPKAVTPLGAGPSPQATAEEFTLTSTLSGHSANVKRVAFSPDGDLLAGVGDDNTIKLWDPQTGGELRTVTAHSSTVSSIAFSPDGSLLASSGNDLYSPPTVKLLDPQSGEELQTLSVPPGPPVHSVAFSPDGSLLASGGPGPGGPGGTGTVKLWDPQSGEELQTLSGHSVEVREIDFSPDGSSGKTKKKRVRTGGVRSVAFSPDGRLLTSGGGDSTVKLWDPQSGEELQTLSGHSAEVLSVAFSPDGGLLASGSAEQTVKLWDPQSGELLRTLSDAGGPVAFSPDGSLLASGLKDGTVNLWTRAEGE